MNNLHEIANQIALLIASLFAIASALHLVGLTSLLAVYRQAGYSRSFLNVVGAATALVAVFLAVPQFRIWGGVLGGLILFAASVAFLFRERYLYAVPAIILLFALAPAMA